MFKYNLRTFQGRHGETDDVIIYEKDHILFNTIINQRNLGYGSRRDGYKRFLPAADY